MKIAVETLVSADLKKVWDSWNDPEQIKQWNTAREDWHSTQSTVDLREGGTFMSRMEAKDGSVGFDFEGTYTRVVPMQEIAISDERWSRGTGRVCGATRRCPRARDLRRRDGKLSGAAAGRVAVDPRQLGPARGGQRINLASRS